eukprot:GFUD01020202.1.p1 GENE.GFUD01020202.1~~GFUD01020202.1.p1  ORF type:complete len:1186 (-),score=434.58 GFUD01020202.1:127-3684(-)
MGVLGLWTLLEPAGKPVPVESLSHKVLAVDISIWLNQAVRGFRDRQGNAVPHAHLLGLYHRICKLLFYRIKPVFVFDGAPPQLKRDTLARRRMKRSKESRAAKLASQKILGNYLQRQAVAQRLQRQTMAMESVARVGTEGIHQLLRGAAKREKDLFELPDIPKNENDESVDIISSSDSETDIILENVGFKNVSDVYQVDVTSSKFTSLPTNLQYEVLNELKGKRKQNSWAKVHEMPQEAEGFSGFQMERLKRRREIQAKLEGVVEELSQEQREVVDSKLFVGDRGGLKKLKTETRRMVSRPDREVVFVSGLRKEEGEDERMGEGVSNKEASKEKEVRELESSDDADDPDISEAVALSMVGEGEPSQEDIFKMIKKGVNNINGATSTSHANTVDIVDDSDDEVVLIPTASLFISNRLGGRSLIKTEIKEEEKDEDVEVMYDDGSDGVGVMSDTESDSGMSEEENSPAEDIFADIFNEGNDVKELNAIIEKAQVNPNPTNNPLNTTSNPTANELLERVSKLDKAGDILADISKRANMAKKTSVAKYCLETDKGHLTVNETTTRDVDRTELTKEISNKLKNGPGIMMKIASRWADAEVSKSNSNKDTKGIKGGEAATSKMFDAAQSSLLKEMADVEKESRLLRFTQTKYNREDSTVDDDDDIDIKTNTDEKALEAIGVKSVSADLYMKTVRQAEGLDNSVDAAVTVNSDVNVNDKSGQVNTENIVYMATAPGFVPSGRRHQTTVIVDNADTEDQLLIPTDITDHLCDESEEMSEAELYALQARLAAEQDTLVAERSKASRLSNSITDSMYQECQDLLQLFGLPWLVAPGEAEAQCAQLDTAGLTDGTITDDSDIWLFGGTKVYKNFFDQEKYVEFFSQTELVQHFGLNREKLVCVALLTGSDYTEGVETVGPVTALEVLAEFPGEGIRPLQDFKLWSGRVKGEMGKEFGLPVGNKTREKLRKLKLSNSFPSDAVVAAYMNPSVDTSGEKFSWAVPNLVGVRDFAMDRFGWDKSQVDKLLKPVIRALEERGSSRQVRIENYFNSSRVKLPDKGMLAASKRVEEAIRKVRGLKSPEKPKQALKVTNKKSIGKKTSKEDQPLAKTSTTDHEEPVAAVSLIAQSCGFVVAPSKDDVILQKLEREKKAKENKEKAAEIFRKSQKAKKLKIQKKFKRPKRVEMEGHGLSESDSE